MLVKFDELAIQCRMNKLWLKCGRRVGNPVGVIVGVVGINDVVVCICCCCCCWAIKLLNLDLSSSSRGGDGGELEDTLVKADLSPCCSILAW